MIGMLNDLLSASEGQLICPIFNEGEEGTQHFHLQQDFVLFCFVFFKKKMILCGNEWDNDKNKQIIKISNQNISPGPKIPS
jgi:hypothetical protein